MLNEEISSLVGGLRSSSNSSLSAFARMEQKVEALEAEADAAGQMGVRHSLTTINVEACYPRAVCAWSRDLPELARAWKALRPEGPIQTCMLQS